MKLRKQTTLFLISLIHLSCFSQLEKLKYNVIYHSDVSNECTYLGGLTEDNNYCVFKLDSEFNITHELCNFFILNKHSSFRVDLVSPQKYILHKGRKDKGIDTVFFDCDLVKGRLIDVNNEKKSLFETYTQANNIYTLDYEIKDLSEAMSTHLNDQRRIIDKDDFKELKRKVTYKGSLKITKYSKEGLRILENSVYETNIKSINRATIINASDSMIYFITEGDSNKLALYKCNTYLNKIVGSKTISLDLSLYDTFHNYSFDSYRNEIFLSFVENKSIKNTNKHITKITVYQLKENLEFLKAPYKLERIFLKTPGYYSGYHNNSKIAETSYNVENSPKILITKDGVNLNIVHSFKTNSSAFIGVNHLPEQNHFPELDHLVGGISDITFKNGKIEELFIEKHDTHKSIYLDSNDVFYANQIKSCMYLDGNSVIAFLGKSRKFDNKTSPIPATYYDLYNKASLNSELVLLNKNDGLLDYKVKYTNFETTKSRCIQSKSGEKLLWIVISETNDPNIVIGNTEVKYSVIIDKY